MVDGSFHLRPNQFSLSTLNYWVTDTKSGRMLYAIVCMRGEERDEHN